MDDNEKQFIGTAPYFLVTDLQASLDYYCDRLGFDRPKLWGNPPEFAMPQRDGYIIMLKQAKDPNDVSPNGPKGGYWDAYVWITDADGLFSKFDDNGVVFEYEPCIQHEYDMKEFAVRDPDGYIIAFGQHHEA
jgi:catechol 2,3-dioxygenase-like lactoylglutathione lyase family enzyme